MSNKEYSIYKLTDPEGKVYIGSTMRKPEERWNNGYGYYGQPFNDVIKRFGWNNIQKEILEVISGKEKADLKEREYIALYDSTNPEFGHNIENGGSTGKKLGNKTKEKISKTLKEKGIAPPSQKGRISPRRKAVVCVDKSGNLVGEYSSIGEASKSLGIHQLRISNVVNKKGKQVKNLLFFEKGEYYGTFKC